ncbi:uncharacterized protein FIBRA_08429 [Fibroporia radiculosa]|uniref:F-box domain-containing protein n=1 Tax=Fibroporia radiculosa TaxID=599839 RepID=J4I2R1_9APHY|nr:uncharacterized protein FIBRA_08429 [Fibroporia radiculosa]CCM06187.1 predicted protein [Fibroporia radiculosa]
MTIPPATLPFSTHIREDKLAAGSQVKGREMCCGFGDNDKPEFLGSMPNTAPLEADVPLGHSIQLPIELWEKVIDVLADEWGDDHWSYETYEARLHVLGRVCRGWHARCRFRACEKLDADRMDKKEVYRLIDALKQDPERCRAIRTVSFDFGRMSVGLFGTFAVCMAHKLPQTERLTFWQCEWEPRQLHVQVFVHITLAFESVTVLELDHVRFPSAVVFGRLVRALPRLSSLKCWNVSFDMHGDVAGRIWELHPLCLDSAELWNSNDVVDFLVLVGAQLRDLIWHDEGLEKCQKLLSVTAESLSSMHIDLADYVFFEGLFPSDFPTDFTSAVNLSVFSISSDFEDLDGAAKILCRAFLPKLIEVTIISTFDYTRTLAFSNSYALLDRAFSSRQYPALKKVTFKLDWETRRSRVMEVISEESWGSHFASNLPALHMSGRLV